MGADIKSLRTRIKSVDSTLHLTKAMGLVASSKIRRATEQMNKSREYSQAMASLISLLTTSPECKMSVFMSERNGDKTKLIVVAGDRGLAGGYNANIFRFTREYENAQIIPIGKRACDRFGGERRLAEKFSVEDAVTLSASLCREFADGEFDRLGIISTEYISIMTQQPKIKWLLPLTKSDEEQKASVVFEPDEVTILNTAVKEYVTGEIVAAVRESFASEVAARRCAMDSAGKNAQEMIDGLQLQYNRARQGAITQEITEIVAGSGS